MSVIASEWKEREVSEDIVAELVAAGYSRLLARLLAVRGVTAADADAYFTPALKDLAKPDELPGVEPAVETILEAVHRHAKVVVFGDYDCDGVCATAILVRALAVLSCDVVPFIPNRLTEGYGMTDASVARMLGEHPDVRLVITVDNGVNSVDLVAKLRARGIDVVVTDHHLPGEELPDCPIVDPKVASPEKLDGLCGAGVAFMVANALINRARAEGLYHGGSVGGPLLVLAGLATITDIMPLRAQNRIIVTEALKRFRKYAPEGLRELLDRASRIGQTSLNSRDFGFLIGPRINAAGRLASGMDALRLVLSTDREEARELARQVDLMNLDRKKVELEMTEEALSKVVKGAAAQVIDLPNGHQGVAGIVAARLLERLGQEGSPVPVCVVVRGHGSARAPDGFNVRDALAASGDVLTRFGGHAAAGGLSVADGQIDEFRRRFAEACAVQAAAIPQNVRGKTFFDAWVDGRELTLEFVEGLSRLEPFGEGNPEPVFAMSGVTLTDVRPVGSDGRHLQLAFRGAGMPRAIWWSKGEMADELRRDSLRPRDVMFTAAISTYGERHVELRIQALRDSPFEQSGRQTCSTP